MPPATTVSAANVTSNLRLDALLKETYRTQTDEAEQALAKRLSLPATTDVNTIDLAGFFDPPTVARWTRGSHIPTGVFGDFSKSHTLTRTGLKISWEIDDEEDDRLKMLPDIVEAAGLEFLKFAPRGIFEYLAGSASLMPSLDTLYDGLDLIASSTRGGDAAGNTYSGTGITPDNIRNDLYGHAAKIAAYTRVTATTEYYWAGYNVFDWSQYLIIASADRDVVRSMDDAFNQQVTLDGTKIAGVSNSFRDKKPEVYHTSRLSGDDWYSVYLGNPKIRPFADVKHVNYATPMPMDQREDRSDTSRDYNQRARAYKQRLGLFPLHWQCITKNDNP